MRLLSIPLLLLLAAPLSLGLLPDNGPSEFISNNGLKINQVTVFRALPFEVKPGGVLKIEGSGFSRTFNKVYFNKTQSINTISQDGTSLWVIIPKGMRNGEYIISVSNSFGVSDSDKLPIKVKITDEPLPGPFIKNATFSNDTIVLIGSGFTGKNYIFTTLGELKTTIPVSSDGTLSFSISNLSLYSKTKDSFLGRSYSMTLSIFVQNEHGASEKPYSMEITI